MAPDRVELHSWEWERGKASHPVYLEHAHIFRRLRFSLRIRFLRHFALMIKLREGLLVRLCCDPCLGIRCLRSSDRCLIPK